MNMMSSGGAYQAAYDMLGANEAIVKHEMRSAQELPMANTAFEMSVRWIDAGPSRIVLPVSPIIALLKPRILPKV